MPDFDEQRILITQAAPGMVLSRPIQAANRTLLCNAGAELSELLIQRITMRGIKRIHVRGHPLPGRSQLPLSDRLQELHLRFSRVHHHPLMSKLEKAIENELTLRA